VVVVSGRATELSVRQVGPPIAPRLDVTVTPAPRSETANVELRRLLDRLRSTAYHWRARSNQPLRRRLCGLNLFFSFDEPGPDGSLADSFITSIGSSHA
jgi:hypothetical protein